MILPKLIKSIVATDEKIGYTQLWLMITFSGTLWSIHSFGANSEMNWLLWHTHTHKQNGMFRRYKFIRVQFWLLYDYTNNIQSLVCHCHFFFCIMQAYMPVCNIAWVRSSFNKTLPNRTYKCVAFLTHNNMNMQYAPHQCNTGGEKNDFWQINGKYFQTHHHHHHCHFHTFNIEYIDPLTWVSSFSIYKIVYHFVSHRHTNTMPLFTSERTDRHESRQKKLNDNERERKKATTTRNRFRS